MAERSIKRGRPPGSTTSDPLVAHAFGAAVRTARVAAEISQEELAHKAGVERSHMGKIERGEHMPTLALALKIAKALGVTASDLVRETESALPKNYRA
jgi:transcriptional regulator with XRE-family HTH domain